MILNHLEKRWGYSGNLSSEAFIGFSRFYRFPKSRRSLGNPNPIFDFLSALSLGSFHQLAYSLHFASLGLRNFFFFQGPPFLFVFYFIIFISPLHSQRPHIWKHRSGDLNFLPPKFSVRIKNGSEDFQWSDPHFYSYFSPYSSHVPASQASPAAFHSPWNGHRPSWLSVFSIYSSFYLGTTTFFFHPDDDYSENLSPVLLVGIFIPTAYRSYFSP